MTNSWGNRLICAYMIERGKRILGHGRGSDNACITRGWQVAKEIWACVTSMKYMNNLL